MAFAMQCCLLPILALGTHAFDFAFRVCRIPFGRGCVLCLCIVAACIGVWYFGLVSERERESGGGPFGGT